MEMMGETRWLFSWSTLLLLQRNCRPLGFGKSPSLPTLLDLLHLCQFQKTEWALRPLVPNTCRSLLSWCFTECQLDQIQLCPLVSQNHESSRALWDVQRTLGEKHFNLFLCLASRTWSWWRLEVIYFSISNQRFAFVLPWDGMIWFTFLWVLQQQTSMSHFHYAEAEHYLLVWRNWLFLDDSLEGDLHV